jgi:hypothetical protein
VQQLSSWCRNSFKSECHVTCLKCAATVTLCLVPAVCIGCYVPQLVSTGRTALSTRSMKGHGEGSLFSTAASTNVYAFVVLTGRCLVGCKLVAPGVPRCAQQSDVWQTAESMWHT